jgi:Mn-dependent DtxR family transcriptional regulator
MPQLSIDTIFEAAIRIQVLEEEALSVVFTPDGISIKFPTTRRLADELGVPHYYVLPYFAMMEQDMLVTRAERVGIMTTHEGSRKFIAMLGGWYHDRAASLLGPVIFAEIQKRMGVGESDE